jgi:hypothetical protein
MELDVAKKNTDREIWRKVKDDYYSPSIHVTEFGNIGINVGGYVLVAPVEKWHEAGEKIFTVNTEISNWRRELAHWLLGW